MTGAGGDDRAWLRQMGWPEFVLEGGLAGKAGGRRQIGADLAAAATPASQPGEARAGSRRAVVVDHRAASPMRPGIAVVRGAGRLRRSGTCPGAVLVLTSPDGALARLAVGSWRRRMPDSVLVSTVRGRPPGSDKSAGARRWRTPMISATTTMPAKGRGSATSIGKPGSSVSSNVRGMSVSVSRAEVAARNLLNSATGSSFLTIS